MPRFLPLLKFFAQVLLDLVDDALIFILFLDGYHHLCQLQKVRSMKRTPLPHMLQEEAGYSRDEHILYQIV